MSIQILMQALRIRIVPRKRIQPVEPACCGIVVSGPEVLCRMSEEVLEIGCRGNLDRPHRNSIPEMEPKHPTPISE